MRQICDSGKNEQNCLNLTRLDEALICTLERCLTSCHLHIPYLNNYNATVLNVNSYVSFASVFSPKVPCFILCLSVLNALRDQPLTM